ncbi:hypothetical protein [Algoriphagus boritolerans]|uniref:hypothetical protein n=1 Tax=Algoriphagus boritolerans TaxID=308111 RepID=UPI002FCE4E1A
MEDHEVFLVGSQNIATKVLRREEIWENQRVSAIFFCGNQREIFKEMKPEGAF